MGDTFLNSEYYNTKSPRSFGGVSRLRRNTAFSKQETRQWLHNQDTYTLHKPIRRHFKRRQVTVGGINQQLQADLIDIRNLKKYNDNVSYLLTLIDVFSRYATVYTLKDKSSHSLVSVFKKMFSSSTPPFKVQTDQGGEFKNKLVKRVFKNAGVDIFSSKNEDIKASVIERFNRTLKERIYRYLTKHNTKRYIHVLNNIVESYNNSYHRSIKRAPSQVNFKNQEDVWHILYHKPNILKHSDLTSGDRVRVSKIKNTFEKGYLPNWTSELFTISTVVYRTNPRTYILKDDNGDLLEGTFYSQELQKVGDKQLYRISSVLKTRVNKGKKELLVEWLGYPTSFNSWIPHNNIEIYN